MISSEVLRQFPLFDGLDPTFLGTLASIGEDATVEKGEWIFHEGDNADALFVITAGCVELKVDLDSKRSTYATLSTLERGSALGWSALVEPYEYKLGALASDRTKLIRFDSQKLRELLDKYPDQGYVLMRGIAQAMAGRVSMLSEEAPGLSFQLVISQILFTLSIVTGILAVVSILVALYAATSDSWQGLIVSLFCLIVPAALMVAARMTYPKVDV